MNAIPSSAPEPVLAPDALASTINALATAFEAFKENSSATGAENREKLARLEAEMSAHQRALDDHRAASEQLARRMEELDNNRASGREEGRRCAVESAYDAAFLEYARGNADRGAVRKLPRAEMEVASEPDGGVFVPNEWDRQIHRELELLSPFRRLVTVRKTKKPAWTTLVQLGAVSAGWIGEKGLASQSDTPQFEELHFAVHKMYSQPHVTQDLLDDSEVNILSLLKDDVVTRFAQTESAAFMAGDGALKPVGLLQHAQGVTPTPDFVEHPLGRIQVVNSGAADMITSDALIRLVYGLLSRHRVRASFIANGVTISQIRQLKDGNGHFLWQPSLQAGEPQKLLGYALHEVPEMPDPVAGAMPLGFGDWTRGFMIADRQDTSVMRDPYTKMDQTIVRFMHIKRVGAALTDPTCMKLMRIAL